MNNSTATSRYAAPPFVLLGAAAAWAGSGPSALGQIILEEASQAAGVSFVHDPDGPSIPGFQDWMVGGIAVADFDNDGWPDIFWASGGTQPDHLFLNLGDGSFADEAASWGIAHLQATCGACAGDFNGDGWVDLYVTSFGHGADNEGQVGRHRLYRNNGDRTFTNVAEAAGVSFTSTEVPSGHGCSFGDYDLDGDLDLCVTAWFAPAAANRLFRNDGDGTFTNVSGSAIQFPQSTWGLQSRFADMDGGPGLLNTSELAISLGLGLYTSVDELRVEWPRGYVTRLFNVEMSKELVIKAPRPGDVNADGKINAADIGLLLSAWGEVHAASDLRFDQTGDRVVDGTGLAKMISQWGM